MPNSEHWWSESESFYWYNMDQCTIQPTCWLGFGQQSYTATTAAQRLQKRAWPNSCGPPSMTKPECIEINPRCHEMPLYIYIYTYVHIYIYYHIDHPFTTQFSDISHRHDDHPLSEDSMVEFSCWNIAQFSSPYVGARSPGDGRFFPWISMNFLKKNHGWLLSGF